MTDQQDRVYDCTLKAIKQCQSRQSLVYMWRLISQQYFKKKISREQKVKLYSETLEQARRLAIPIREDYEKHLNGED